MIYLDTNLIVALCIRESDSHRVETALAMIEKPLFTSEWTRVEFTSAIGIKLRNRELSDRLARRALADYYEAVEPGISVVTPTRDDYILAADCLQGLSKGLRSGDALHLAVACNHKADFLMTLDCAFIKAAKGLNITVRLPW